MGGRVEVVRCGREKELPTVDESGGVGRMELSGEVEVGRGDRVRGGGVEVVTVLMVEREREESREREAEAGDGEEVREASCWRWEISSETETRVICTGSGSGEDVASAICDNVEGAGVIWEEATKIVDVFEGVCMKWEERDGGDAVVRRETEKTSSSGVEVESGGGCASCESGRSDCEACEEVISEGVDGEGVTVGVLTGGDERRELVGMAMVNGEEAAGDEFLKEGAPLALTASTSSFDATVEPFAAMATEVDPGFLPFFTILFSSILWRHSHTLSLFFPSSPPTVTVSQSSSTAGVKRSAKVTASLSGTEWKWSKMSSGRGRISSSAGELMVRV